MIFRSISELKTIAAPLVVAAGVFDGVHLGHQTLIRRALENACCRDASCVILTFDPHPAQFLRPASAPRLLTSTAHKIRLIQQLGAEHILLLSFNAALAALPAAEFIYLLSLHAPFLREICVGYNWSFGRRREGNIPLLRRLSTKFGFRVTEIGAVEMGGETISSTRIRDFIQSGDLHSAAKFLGRKYTILGTVVRGEGRGRSIGFPTANLATHNELFPPDGVYAVHTQIDGAIFSGVTNIGTRPTFPPASQRTLEVHLLDYSGSLYGKDAKVCFEVFLRKEHKFHSLQLLRTQIEKDIHLARALLKK
ncbi:Riboflavin biosynthesis protein RibF [Candidatus Xiphinematobacter sp. Idaho Grape]|uniref:bifunctional riboflavin kinase/FAD synthetase n=1 Tax=Candidatus Xiphinematobacter sp. Idaho Grape TaxID=1704307 RepID=UPI0007065B86|nr:bifunctional riboflavin kinase/FAD synthetase [Candidatus Xiphinematobacter sp. Idaho Grape]ALJ56334.1 Riboflavin biosynthesis protein RibF [Candidatus Xiphinematobacter sp. Idaho Grape]